MAYILDMLRVPVAKPFNRYKFISAEMMVAHLLEALKNKHSYIENSLNEVILANAFGTGGNMARYAILEAGMSNNISGFTIDSQCSGGLKSVEIADAYLESGKSDLIIAGGAESKSLAPTKNYHPNDSRITNGNSEYFEAIFSPGEQYSLAKSAESTALKYKVSKIEMQEWKVLSTDRLKSSYEVGLFERSIVPLNNLSFDYYSEINIENFQRLQSENLIDRTTAAQNADAAAVVLMCNEVFLQKNNLQPLAKVIDYVSIGHKPEMAPESTLVAIKALVEKNKDKEIDLFEVSESYAVIPIMVANELKISKDKINILGGAMAFGHPFGATGTICLMNLVLALKSINKKRGIVSIPAAGGLATAMLIEVL